MVVAGEMQRLHSRSNTLNCLPMNTSFVDVVIFVRTVALYLLDLNLLGLV